MKKENMSQTNYSVMDPTKQKRKNARMNINLTAQLKLEAKGDFHNCEIDDVGTGGIRFHGGMYVLEGDKVVLRFELEENKPLEAHGPILRTQGKYAVVQIPETGAEKLVTEIQEYIHKNLFSSDSPQKLL